MDIFRPRSLGLAITPAASKDELLRTIDSIIAEVDYFFRSRTKISSDSRELGMKYLPSEHRELWTRGEHTFQTIKLIKEGLMRELEMENASGGPSANGRNASQYNERSANDPGVDNGESSTRGEEAHTSRRQFDVLDTIGDGNQTLSRRGRRTIRKDKLSDLATRLRTSEDDMETLKHEKWKFAESIILLEEQVRVLKKALRKEKC